MNTTRVGIIGCGGFSGAHARRLAARSDALIVALASRTSKSIAGLVERRLADYNPAPRWFTSTSEMYSEMDLDAVVICTPHYLHKEQAIEALRAGCHVLIEKPMVISSGEAQELKQVAAEHPDAVIALGYNPAYSPAMKLVRDAVADERYGPLQLVTGYLSQNWRHLTSGSWRQRPAESGGGQAIDSGAHLIHSLCSVVGAEPDEVFAYADNKDTRVDINSVVAAKFANGVLATLTVGGDSALDGTGMSLIFRDGRIDVDGWKGEWVRCIGKDGVHEQLTGLEEPDPDASFLDAIAGGAPVGAPLADGLAVAAFTDAMLASAASGRPERIGSLGETP